jgi:opacity protein-like surface antigen
MSSERGEKSKILQKSRRPLHGSGPRGQLCLAVLLCMVASAEAADLNRLRPYFWLRGGGMYYNDTDSVPGVSLDNPSQWPFQFFGFGANFSRYWSLELAVEYTETGLFADITRPNSKENVGEYSQWSIMPQARLRYPLLKNRLVPYALAGAGLGIGEFNDRKVELADIFSFSGGQDTTFVGAAGLGLEYFVRDNIAVGIEAKQRFGFETDVILDGRTSQLDLDGTLFSAGLRLFYDRPGAPMPGGRMPAPADSDERRYYVSFGIGAAFFTDPDSNADLQITSPTRVDFGAGAGVNFNRHWSAEIRWDYWEPDLKAPGIGEVSEYSLWDIVAHLRWRYPMQGGRVVPYVVAGGGVGTINVNDQKVPLDAFPLETLSVTTSIGSFGGGIDYFLMHNISLGLETRYIAPFETDIRLGDRRIALNNATVLLNAVLRVHFP